MPVVTIRVAATAENQKGESIQVPPSEAVANLGPAELGPKCWTTSQGE